MAGRRDNHEQASASSDNNSTATAASIVPTLPPSNSTSPNSTLSSNSTLSANSTQSANTSTPVADSTPSSAAPIEPTASAGPDALAKEAEACHRTDLDHDDAAKFSPFCKPREGQNVTIGDEYPFIWDSDVFESNSTNRIELRYMNSSDILNTSEAVANEKGYILIKMQEKWLNESDSKNITTFIRSEPDDSDHPPKTKPGPTLTLIKDPSPASSGKDPKKLGVKVGVPFAMAFLVVVLLLLCLGTKKQRRKAWSKVTGSRSSGYLASRSRGQRTDGGIQLREDDVGRGQFRDEPDRGGVELQDRDGRRHYSGDSSFGSLGSSPTQEGFGGRSPGANNVFRDEISRQRGGDRDVWR
ncbi:hypothetical protein MMC22_010856 [Lobaria immixta]|nr:hypothetical protein [Lobaria immixta]